MHNEDKNNQKIRKEIESIRSKYLPKEKVDSKIERIKYFQDCP